MIEEIYTTVGLVSIHVSCSQSVPFKYVEAFVNFNFESFTDLRWSLNEEWVCDKCENIHRVFVCIENNSN